MVKTKIVAIGGGDIRKKTTLKIDKEILQLSGKKHPRLLFIPTASSDAMTYWKHIEKYFGTFLGCKTDVLLLIKEKLSAAAIRKKILSADIIYVGGGNTLMMMRVWRRLKVDSLLKNAYQKGTVLSGMSAGSICWFTSGHSDSMSFAKKKKWSYINVRGLGLIQGLHCPHYDSHTRGARRRKNFQDMVRKYGDVGIGIENNCAIVFTQGTYRVIRSKKNADAYLVSRVGKKAVSERITSHGTIASLYSHSH